jgi:Fe-S-cluster containining protein
MDQTLQTAVRAASARPDVESAMRALYADVQSAIDARRPKCDISGRCCRFEEYGHRLYVTTLELAAFVAAGAGEARAEPRQVEIGRARLGGKLAVPLLDPVSWDGAGCPFQRSKLCGVHSIRPFGCRMFFCDPTSTGWQNDAYERFHARIQQLHADLNVPYFYVEWRHALRALGLTPEGLSNAKSSF